ncbi:MAG: hypothetical protein JXA25_01770 [Anaerolineales bacterium]|nr:hypothetical protein [Anaerolineales bacterium]
MNEFQTTTTYFKKAGKENTERALELARARAEKLGIQKVLVATTEGSTGALAAQLFRDLDVIAVTHSTGFKKANEQELQEENRAAIEEAGATILTCQHAFGGVNRAVRKKFDTTELDEIIAHTLRRFGEGMKVVVETAMMAADAGLVRTDEAVMCIAGTGRGADTVVILQPANAQTFFEIRILEIICMPAPAHPAFAD